MSMPRPAGRAPRRRIVLVLLALVLTGLVVLGWPLAATTTGSRVGVDPGLLRAAPGPGPAAQSAQRYPGLTPFPPAPPPPAVKPVVLRGGLPPVIWHIPTDQKIVFVTIDDGWEKDPRLVQLIGDLHVPVTMFLTDAAIRSDLG